MRITIHAARVPRSTIIHFGSPLKGTSVYDHFWVRSNVITYRNWPSQRVLPRKVARARRRASRPLGRCGRRVVCVRLVSYDSRMPYFFISHNLDPAIITSNEKSVQCPKIISNTLRGSHLLIKLVGVRRTSIGSDTSHDHWMIGWYIHISPIVKRKSIPRRKQGYGPNNLFRRRLI